MKLTYLSNQAIFLHDQSEKRNEKRKELLSWHKKHFSSFLKGFHLPNIVSDLRVHLLHSVKHGAKNYLGFSFNSWLCTFFVISTKLYIGHHFNAFAFFSSTKESLDEWISFRLLTSNFITIRQIFEKFQTGSHGAIIWGNSYIS